MTTQQHWILKENNKSHLRDNCFVIISILNSNIKESSIANVTHNLPHVEVLIYLWKGFIRVLKVQ